METIFLVLCLWFVPGFVYLDQSKRLLLNDPAIVQDRLNRLEHLLIDLNNTVTQQAKTIRQQAATIHLQSVDLQNQASSIQKQEEFVKISLKSTGSTYIRWGRSDCAGNNTQTIYSGYAGGSKHTDSGAAVENVCLPPDPEYDRSDGSLASGFMFGAEYNNDFFGQGADSQDVPCAVCEAVGSTSTLMIPGKNTCYNGWKREYTGYLSAHYHTYVAAASYACVDQHAQFLTGGHVQYDEHLFGLVVTKCGSLPCPPYRDGVPMTCVVCSK